MEIKKVRTYWVRIYMAGDIDRAKNIISDYVWENPQCANVYETEYIYTGGREKGFCAEFINYPRFNMAKSKIYRDAEMLAERLMNGLNQISYTIESSNMSVFYSRREDMKP
jgi:hypothetical protein